MINRVLYFLATNIAILVVLSITMRLLGLDFHLAQYGQDITGLLVLSAIVGMAGSFISLAMSKTMAKRFSGARVIESPSNAREIWLLQTVEKQSSAAGIGMPEVAIFQSRQINAFATGMNRNNALVAVSSGLLDEMTSEEAEAVVGHEVSHVANGDMITLALIQGVLNTFVFFLARIIGQMVNRAVFRSSGGPAYWIIVIIAELVLGILASMVVMYFSRKREFRADRGGAELAGKDNMIAALMRLQSQYEPSVLPDQLAAFGISGGVGSGFSIRKLFRSHPPLEERIEALRQL